MKKDGKASISLKKILILSLIAICMLSLVAFANNTQLKTIKVTYANGEEVNVITTKTVVKDILEENHIIVLPEEFVFPDLEAEITDSKTITISKEKIEEKKIAEIQETKTMEAILQEYAPIIEKIVTERVEIPYETITKDVSGGSSNKQNSVITSGRNGIKEVTYKIKYQNDVEIEKTEIDSKVIREPINKVVQISSYQIISRTGVRTTVTYGNTTWAYSEEELDLLCAITAQESSSSYEGALAVITTACNRTASSRWRYNGSDPLSQYKARGQFCYTIDNYWKRRLNGNYADYVKQAVLDALNGKRNHNYLSFRTAGTASGVIIGGNAYFNEM